jgi:hypothetical protein
MLSFERNNRESIHRMSSSSKFHDLCENWSELYLCNDALNIANINEGDLIKFNLFTNGSNEKVYGICTEIHNFNHKTFMVLSHVDQLGREFFLDYVYSSFLQAFVRVNHSGQFEDWCDIEKSAVTPDWFKEYWITNNAPNLIQNTDEQSSNNAKHQTVKQTNTTSYDNKLSENIARLETAVTRISEIAKSLTEKFS